MVSSLQIVQFVVEDGINKFFIYEWGLFSFKNNVTVVLAVTSGPKVFENDLMQL